MGCCGSSGDVNVEELEDAFDNKGTNKSIDKYMKSKHKEEGKIIKLLLLGAGSSGKSTLFRQIQSIHGDHYSYNDDGSNEYFTSMNQIKHDIKMNIFVSIIKLLKQTRILSVEHGFDDCKIDWEDGKVKLAMAKIVECKTELDREDIDEAYGPLEEIGQLMAFVWGLPGIQHTYTRRQYFSIIENIDHFLNQITDVMVQHEDWTPDRRDILLSRIRTTGIIKREYTIQKVDFHMYDVGGQRNERKKWISLFDNVDALIFVVALNGYCSVIFEDESVNKMRESLNLFEEQCNSKYFSSQKTQFILFLNKDDLFRDRLKAGLKLEMCFEDSYDGPNYGDKALNDEDDEEWFQTCYQKSLDFVRSEFLAKNNNNKITSIFTHVTTATDQNNIEIVFNDVRTGIIQRNLAKIGVAYNNTGSAGGNF
eukprot:174148_1